MWGLALNLVAQGVGLWQKKKSIEESQAKVQRKRQINKQLAAEQLAITYNSIVAKSLQVAAEARQKIFEVRLEERAAMGSARVQAAAAGASGKRVQLARKQNVEGKAENLVTQVNAKHKEAQDSLIRRSEMEERATMNRLISGQPDMPSGDMTADIAGAIKGGIDAWGTYKDQKAETAAAQLGDPTAPGPSLGSGGTGPQRLGLYTR